MHLAAEAVLLQQQTSRVVGVSTPRPVETTMNQLPSTPVAAARLTAALHDRRKARDTEVLALHQQGASLGSIAHRLDLDRSTVRRIVRAGVSLAGVRARRA